MWGTTTCRACWSVSQKGSWKLWKRWDIVVRPNLSHSCSIWANRQQATNRRFVHWSWHTKELLSRYPSAKKAENGSNEEFSVKSRVVSYHWNAQKDFLIPQHSLLCDVCVFLKHSEQRFFFSYFPRQFFSTFFVVAVVRFFMTTKLRDILRNIYCEVSFAMNELSFRQQRGRGASGEERDAGERVNEAARISNSLVFISPGCHSSLLCLCFHLLKDILCWVRGRRVCYAIRKTRVQSKALCYFDYSKHHKCVSSNWKTTTETRGNKKKRETQ